MRVKKNPHIPNEQAEVQKDELAEVTELTRSGAGPQTQVWLQSPSSPHHVILLKVPLVTQSFDQNLRHSQTLGHLCSCCVLG